MADRFQHLFDSLCEEAVVLDRQLRVTYANPAWLRRVGLDASQVLGRPCYQVLLATSQACPIDRCGAYHVLETGARHVGRCAGLDGSPDMAHVEVSSSPVFDKDGRAMEVVQVFHRAGGGPPSVPCLTSFGTERRPAAAGAKEEDGPPSIPPVATRGKEDMPSVPAKAGAGAGGGEVADALLQAALLASSGEGLPSVLEVILDQLARVVSYDSASVVLIGDQFFRIIAGRGFPPGCDAIDYALPSDDAKLGRMQATHQPVVIDDVRLDATWIPIPGTESVRSWIGAPLLSDGRMIGSLNVDKREVGYYTAQDAQLVLSFANQAAAVIENAQLLDGERQRAAHLELIRDFSQRVLSILDPDALLDYAVKAIQSQFNYYYVDVFLVDPDSAYVVFHSGSREDLACIWRQQCLRYRIAREGITGHVAATGEPYLCNDVLHDPHYIADELLPGTRSELAVPIRVGGRMLGVLDINSDRPIAFGEQDLFIGQSMADQLAIGLENARLFSAEAGRRREAETLQAATQALSATLDLKEVLRLILEELREVVPYDSCSVQQLKGDTLEIIGGHGFPNLEELLGVSFDAVSGHNPNCEVLRTGAPFIVDDAPAVYSEFRREPHAASHIRSWLGVPLLFGDRLIGMIALDKREPSFYRPGHARLASAFAAQAAIAIENARLFAAERQSRLELKSIQATAALLSADLHIETLLQRIVTEAAQAFRAEATSLMLWDEDETSLTVAASHGLSAGYAQKQRVPRDRALTALPASGSPRPICLEDLSATPFGSGELVASEGLCSLLAIPLMSQGTVRGVLNIYSKGYTRTFEPSEIELAETFAAQAGVAIYNARLYEQTERRVAELEAVRQAALGLTSSLQLKEVLESILECSVRLLREAQDAHIFLYKDGRLTFGVALWADGLRDRPWSEPRPQGLTYTVARSGELIVVPDIRDHPLFVGVPDDWKGAIVGLPLKIGQRVVGVMNISFQQPRQVSGSDLRVLELLADQAAIAVENANLYEELSHHLEEVTLLNRVALAASSTLDFDDLICRSMAALLEMPQYERANVLMLDQDTGELALHPALARLSRFPERVNFRIPLGRGVCGRVAMTGLPIRVDDVRQEAEYIAGYSNTLSELAVPLRVGDRVIGVLDAQSANANTYTDEDERLLVTLAGQLSTVMENARLFKETQQRVRELAALSQVSQALNEARDLRTILSVVLEEAFALLSSQEGSILLIDPPGGNRLRMVAERGLGSEVMDIFNQRPVYVTEGTYQRALASGHIVEVPDTRTDPDFLDDVGSRAVSITNVPLVTERRAIGLIAVDGVAKDDMTRRLLMAMADMAAVAIDKERLHQETSDRLAEVSTLYTLATQITGSLSLSRVLESIVTILKLTINCRACCIFLTDSLVSSLRLEASSGLPEEQRSRASLPLDRGIGSRVVHDRRPTYVADATAEVAYFDPQVRSLLIVPLIVRNQVIGVLSLDDDRPNAFGDEVRLLTIAAAQAAVAIENAQLYESLQASYRDLEQAYDALRELDRMKSELVQNISHELRTPLTFIKGYVELLQDGDMGPMNEQQQMALDIVAAKSNALSHLVDDIITLQHASRDRVRLTRMSMSSVGRAAVRAALASAAGLDINIHGDIPDDLPSILGDEQRLGQVMDNLLSNALKFSNPGTTITVRMSDKDDYILTEVQDEGIGIPPEKVGRVFDRFYQVDGSTTRRFGGTGLGLAIVKQIVEAHNGRVGVRSEQNKGSCFYFTIPKAEFGNPALFQGGQEPS